MPEVSFFENKKGLVIKEIVCHSIKEDSILILTINLVLFSSK
jgi:hypothetical protein